MTDQTAEQGAEQTDDQSGKEAQFGADRDLSIGIGLPNTLPIEGTAVADWARRAERRGFSTLSTIDRIVYPSFDSLITLGFAAGATSRIGLFSDILLAPLYPPVWLAKAAASLDALSGGRLTLGLAVGGRQDDYRAMGQPFEHRGRTMDQMLDLMIRSWAGQPVAGGDFPVGPAPARAGRVRLLIGGNSDPAIRRAVQFGDGWTAGGGGPQAASAAAARVRQAWSDAGRQGEPRLVALAYYGLGDDEASERSLRRYYGYTGPGAERVAGSALRRADAIRSAVAAYRDAGMSELMLIPSVPAVDQVDRLADIVFADDDPR